MNRRTFLTATTLALGTGLAGCTGDSDPDGGNGNGNGDGPIADTDTETVSADCGSEDDETMDVDIGSDTVTLTGIISTPDPCHAVVLADTSVDETTLSASIDVEDTTDEDEGCMDCVGAVEYEATITLSEDVDIETVELTHVGSGSGTFSEASAQATPAGAEIRNATIETVDGSCASGDEEDAAVTSDEDATVTTEDESVVIEGMIPASNPCHEAILGDVSVDGSELQVTVDLEQQEGMCVECVGIITYEATVEVTDVSALDSAQIDHVGGGSFTTSWENASAESSG